MNLISVVGVILVVAVASVVLKKYLPEYSMVINILAGAMVLVVIFGEVLGVIAKADHFVSASKIPKEYVDILFKSLGICFLTQFASDSCKDAGEGSLANKIELAGKVAIIVLALPLFEKVIQTSLELIKVH